MSRYLPLAAALLGVVVLLSPRLDAAEDLATQIREFESLLSQRDEAGYEAMADVLGRLADRRTDGARDALRSLLDRHGAADRRRAALVLGALVRHGGAREVDGAVRWVEQTSRDPLLIELLHRILAEARSPAALAWMRTDGLQKATPRVKVQIVRALGSAKDSAAVLPLVKLLWEQNLLVRIEALEALGKLRATAALGLITRTLRDTDPFVRDAAARALGAIRDARGIPPLIEALRDEHPRVVESAARSLGAIGEPEAIPALILGLERVADDDLRLVDRLVEALRAISGKMIEADVELWRAWWAAVKDRPFIRGTDRPGPNTVEGPRYYNLPVRSSRVIFVLDISRSMGWNERLAAAKEEIVKVLEQLPSRTRFNVILYSDRAWAWKSKLTRASKTYVRQATDFVRAQKPLNGTNSHAALAKAFLDDDVDTIFFLTDGHPSVGAVTDPELILLAVREWNRLRRIRVHAVTLLRGEPPPAYAGRENPSRALKFMRDLAQQNDGLFKHVR